MQSDYDPGSSETFIEVARQRALLSDEDARTLLDASIEKGVMSSQIAVEMGLLKPVEVEIVEAFTSPNDLAPGYELLDVLGYGALGIVYRAHQPRLQRDVAVKSIIQPLSQQNSVARFQQEGAAIGRLQHPNIVSAYDSGSHRNRLYLVMELVNGDDLRQRLRSGPLAPSTALPILRQTASGLAHALSHQIIHRDIKPGNLLLTDAPAGFDLPKGIPLVKIADFGLARLNPPGGADDEDTRLTMTGAALGTPMYCAPEQLTGDDIDHRADIYGLGATLFQMLSGTTPFESEKVSKLIAAKVTGQPPRLDLLPPDLHPDVRQLLLDMMHHDPEQRVPDYETLIQRIDDIQPYFSSAIRSRPMPDKINVDTSPTSNVRRSKRFLAPTIAIASIVCLAALGLSAVWNRQRAPNMVAAGWELPLFDGKTLTGWTDQTGLWFGDTDAEGGLILAGKGSLLRPFPAFPSSAAESPGGHGFRIGIDLPPSRTAEVHFGFEGRDAQTGERLVMRYSKDAIALGRRDGLSGDFKVIGEAKEQNIVPTDAPSYHEVRAELHGDHWFAYFDGNYFADAPADVDANNRSFQLVALDGDIHFEGPSVYGLKAKADELQ